MNDEFEDDSYTTAATIEVGMRDNGQGITAKEKSLMDNDHTNPLPYRQLNIAF